MAMAMYYALIPPHQLQRQLFSLREELFQMTGDSSFSSLEPWIILGPTSDTYIRKGLTCPNLPLSVNGVASYESGTLLLPVPADELLLLRTQLQTTFPYCGVYLGQKKQDIERKLYPFDDVMVALVEIKKEGALTLWRVVAQKHLRSDRGL